MTDQQPSLFDQQDAGVDQIHLTGTARAEFIAGMLGAWLYGEKATPKAAKEALLGLAGRTLAEASRIKELRS